MFRKYLLQFLPFFAALFCGMYYIGAEVTGHDLSFFPGDLGDARFNNYLLEHDFLFFTGEVPSYWNAGFMFPELQVISYSDNLLGSAPFYAFFRFLGNDRETSFQLWILLMYVLNYTCCYFFLRYLVKNNLAAICGAMIFAFSIGLQSQMPHAQTMPRFIVPVTLLMCLLFLRELRAKYFFLVLLGLVYQLYCGIYLGFMLCVPAAIVIICSVIIKRGLLKMRIRDGRWVISILSAILVSGFLLMPLMMPYIERAKLTGFYSFEKVLGSLPTVISYLYSVHGTAFWDFNSNAGVSYPAFWDHQIFPGGIALLAAIVCLVAAILKIFRIHISKKWQYDLNMKVIFISGLLTLLLFLKVNDSSLYKILFQLPGFGSMKALQRIINIELVFFSAAVSYLVLLLRTKNRIANSVIFLCLVVLIIADNRRDPETVYKVSKQMSQERVKGLIAKISTVDPETILAYEPDTITGKQIYYQLDAMLAAQTLGIRTLNGYSATAPHGYDHYWSLPNEASRHIWLEVKRLSEEHIQVVH